MSNEERPMSIWYFIGLLLLVYGVLITGAGIWEWMNPPAKPVVLAELRAGVWWGVLCLLIGAVYTVKFAPGKGAR